MPIARVEISGQGSRGAMALAREGDGVPALDVALALGSLPFERIARAEAALAAGYVQHGLEGHTVIEQAVEAFMRSMPFAEKAAVAKGLAEGRFDMARLARLMVSMDDVLDAFCEGGENKGELSNKALADAMKALLMAGWAPNFVDANEGEMEEGSSISSVAFVDGRLVARSGLEAGVQWAEQAAEALNAKCHPLRPYEAHADAAGCSFSFSPEVALGALAATRLAGCGWVKEWVGSGGGSLEKQEGRLSVKPKRQELLVRLWMDDPDPFRLVEESLVEEMSKWSMAMRPMPDGLCRAEEQWQATGLAGVPSVNLAVNVGLRLMGHVGKELSDLGMATIFGLAGSPAAPSVEKMLEAAISAGGGMAPIQLARFQALLAKMQRFEMAKDAPERGGEAPAAARLGRSL